MGRDILYYLYGQDPRQVGCESRRGGKSQYSGRMFLLYIHVCIVGCSVSKEIDVYFEHIKSAFELKYSYL